MNRPLTFFVIPADPLWPLIVIAIDVLVIWALAAHGSEMTQAEPGVVMSETASQTRVVVTRPFKPVLGRVTPP